MCFVLGPDNTKKRFLVYRLERGQWKKISEKKQSKRRYGHSCELLEENRLVLIGGDYSAKGVGILDLGSLSWSEVK